MINGLSLVIVAAGSSSRMGGVDKVWAQLGDTNVLWHSVRTLGPWAEQTVIVVPRAQVDRVHHESGALGIRVTATAGGPRRQDSVACGLAALGSGAMVAVHDAARPFATADLLRRGVALLNTCDGAVPGLVPTDTVKEVNEQARVVKTLARDVLRAVQTPQVFQRESLLAAHSSHRGSEELVTDDASLLECYGYAVRIFPGEPLNMKITTEHDLALARFLLDRVTP